MTGCAHILVRLDANHRIGLAHAIRVSAILGMLKTPLRITVAGAGDLISAFFPAAQLRQVFIEDPEAFFALIGESRPDLILVDHPQPGYGFWSKLNMNAKGIPIVVIDDVGGEVDADLIINGTVLDQYHRYPMLRSQAKLLTGREYSLIRPVFGNISWRDFPDPSVIIVVGSGDRARDWALYLMSGKIDLSGWGKVKMIVGQAFPDMAKLRHDCDALGVSLESGVSGDGMAGALSQSSVALITGGMIVYEALAVGVPAVVFPQMENLIPEARWFAERGCILDLGYEGGMDGNLISEAVGRLLSSSSARVAMSKAQRATIDGHGMVRAAQAIDGALAGNVSGGRHPYQDAQP